MVGLHVRERPSSPPAAIRHNNYCSSILLNTLFSTPQKPNPPTPPSLPEPRLIQKTARLSLKFQFRIETESFQSADRLADLHPVLHAKN